MSDDLHLWADMERPDIGFLWRERSSESGCDDWVPVDWTAAPHTWKLQFLVPRTLAVAYEKTTDIVGLDGTSDPNVIASFTQDELITAQLDGRYKLRLWARNTLDNKDRGPFRANDLPIVHVHRVGT